MSEFVFRNLSVRLFPVSDQAVGAVCTCCSFAFECDACSECTDGTTAPPCEGPTVDPGGGGCGESGCGPTGCGESCDISPCGGLASIDPCGASFPPCEHDEVTTCFEESQILCHLPAADEPGRGHRPLEVIQGELDLLRVELRAALGLPPDPDPHRRRHAEPIAEPAAEQLDEVRAALLDAVAEIDERGRERDAGRPSE
jgi:hypothetical protein